MIKYRSLIYYYKLSIRKHSCVTHVHNIMIHKAVSFILMMVIKDKYISKRKLTNSVIEFILYEFQH